MIVKYKNKYYMIMCRHIFDRSCICDKDFIINKKQALIDELNITDKYINDIIECCTLFNKGLITSYEYYKRFPWLPMSCMTSMWLITDELSKIELVLVVNF